MLSVVTFKWRQPGYHTRYDNAHVNVLYGMVSRQYPDPFRFFCVTDDHRGLDSAIETVPLWHDHASVPNPGGPEKVSCYRRLRLFSGEARDIFGERLVSLDLDTVIVGDLRPLWNRCEEFVICQDAQPNTYNGSMFLLSTATRQRAWTDFRPDISPRLAREQTGHGGSDQAWLTYCYPGEATWTPQDGVLSFKRHARRGPLPESAKVVLFHGVVKPWGDEAQAFDWVQMHYR